MDFRNKFIAVLAVCLIFLCIPCMGWCAHWVQVGSGGNGISGNKIYVDKVYIDYDGITAPNTENILFFWEKYLYKTPALLESKKLNHQKINYFMAYIGCNCKERTSAIFQKDLFGLSNVIIQSVHPAKSAIEWLHHNPESIDTAIQEFVCTASLIKNDGQYAKLSPVEQDDIMKALAGNPHLRYDAVLKNFQESVAQNQVNPPILLDPTRWRCIWGNATGKVFIDTKTVQPCQLYSKTCTIPANPNLINGYVFWVKYIVSPNADAAPEQVTVNCKTREISGQEVPPDSPSEAAFRYFCHTSY